MEERAPAPGAERRRGLHRSLAVLLGLGLWVVAELLLRFSPYNPPSREEWSREMGVVSIEHYYPQFSQHFVTLGEHEGQAVCGPSPEHTMHGSSEADAMQPDRFFCQKPEGTQRVVFLGGSSVQGFLLGDAQTIPSRLEAHLAARGLDSVEVINAGVAGYNTLQLKRMMSEVWGFSPDVLVIYAGHNDYTYYPAVEAALRSSPALRATRGIGDRLATWRLLRAGARRLGLLESPRESTMQPSGSGPSQARAVFQVDRLAVPRSRTARKDLVDQQNKADTNIWAFYEENITWFSEEAAARGTELLLVTPVARPDWRPSGSIHWKDLSDEELASWETHWQGSIQNRSATRGGQDPTQEAQVDGAQLEAALAIDDSYSELLYLVARRAHREGDAERAVALYRKAFEQTPPSRCDRAPNRHADRILSLGRRLGRPTLDLRPITDAAARIPGLPGDEIFLDGLHFNPYGANLVAEAVAAEIEDLLD